MTSLLRSVTGVYLWTPFGRKRFFLRKYPVAGAVAAADPRVSPRVGIDPGRRPGRDWLVRQVGRWQQSSRRIVVSGTDLIRHAAVAALVDRWLHLTRFFQRSIVLQVVNGRLNDCDGMRREIISTESCSPSCDRTSWMTSRRSGEGT